MRTECIAGQLEFEGFDGRRVVAALDGGAVTSDAGAGGRPGDRADVFGLARNSRLTDAIVQAELAAAAAEHQQTGE